MSSARLVAAHCVRGLMAVCTSGQERAKLAVLALAVVAACAFPMDAQAQYCDAGAQRCNVGIPQITRVTINTLNHLTDAITGSGTDNHAQCYSDFTNVSTDLFQGQSYVIQVNNPNPFNADQSMVWIDWNQDFTFGNVPSGEAFVLTRTGNIFSGLVSVPGGATVGPTRMRVRVTYSAAFGSCGEPLGTGATTNMGEVEDYTIVVRSSTTGACCDATGPCTNTTSAACTSGTYQGNGTACNPNPCGGACCAPNGTCSVTIGAACGSPSFFTAGAVCEAGVCNGVCCDATTGACALTPNGSGACPCGSVWQGFSSTCASNPCSAGRGACCAETTAACSVTTRFGCNATTSIFLGEGTACVPTPCAAAACCNLVTGTCALVPNKGGCSVQSGVQSLAYLPGAVCSPSPCGGACCNNNTGACTVALAAGGCAAGTTFMGAGAVCTPTPCPVGACCATSGACSTTAAGGCTSPSTFQGAGSVCSPANPCGGSCCNNTTRACTTTANSGTCAGGTFTAGALCAPDPCPAGVCCNNNTGVCAAKAAAGCAAGTTFIANGSCVPSPCAAIAACCHNTTGACTATTSAGCVAGSTWMSGASSCAFAACGQGACCNNTTGACTASTVAGCTGGNMFIADTPCTPNPCGQGACCNTSNGACTLTGPGGCVTAPANSFQGAGTACTGGNNCGGACCNNTTGACTVVLDIAACPGGNLLGGALCSPYPCGALICCNNTTQACTVAAAAGCAAGNTLNTGVCGPNPCGLGACCPAQGTCSVTSIANCFGLFQGTGTTCTPGALCYSETEPNDVLGAANGPFQMATNDTIVGTSTAGSLFLGGASTDRVLVQPVPAAPGIYRHRLVLTSPTLIQRMQIRGHFQFDNNPSSPDVSTVFSAGSGADLTQIGWYSFGAAVPVQVSITGGTGTGSEAYKLTLTTTTITPFDLGTIPGGLITVSSIGATTENTDFWVYDASFNPVPGFGNDDAPDPTGHFLVQSIASKDLTSAGTYYVAMTDYNLINNQLSPVGDRHPSKSYFDQAGIVGSMGISASPSPLDLSFKVIDGDGVVHAISGAAAGLPARKAAAYDVVWVKFTVSAPSTGSCCQPAGTCVIASQSACTQLHAGTYGGNGSVCGSCTQPPSGACCQSDGSCVLSSSFACTTYSGAFRGAGTTCAAAACPRTIDASTDLFSGGVGVIFVDVTASGGRAIQVTGLEYYATQSWNNAFPFPLLDVFVHPNPTNGNSTATYMGAEFGDCPSQSPPPNGWVFNTEAVKNPYPVGGSFAPETVTLATPVTVPAGQTVGFCLVARAASIKAAQTLGVGAATFMNSDITLFSDRARASTATNPNWSAALNTEQRSFSGRFFYNVVGVCCRGATCSTSVAPQDCTAAAPAGATFVSAAGCNTGSSTTTPCCYADYNKAAGVTVADIFAFLADWFSGSTLAIPGGDGTTGMPTVTNIFQFLTAWFAGGC